MSEMVERVARALRRSRFDGMLVAVRDEGVIIDNAVLAAVREKLLDDFIKTSPAMWGADRLLARVAIAAMREPTDGMVAGVKAKLYGSAPGEGMAWAIDPYQAMIDEALKE